MIFTSNLNLNLNLNLNRRQSIVRIPSIRDPLLHRRIHPLLLLNWVRRTRDNRRNRNRSHKSVRDIPVVMVMVMVMVIGKDHQLKQKANRTSRGDQV